MLLTCWATTCCEPLVSYVSYELRYCRPERDNSHQEKKCFIIWWMRPPRTSLYGFVATLPSKDKWIQTMPAKCPPQQNRAIGPFTVGGLNKQACTILLPYSRIWHRSKCRCQLSHINKHQPAFSIHAPWTYFPTHSTQLFSSCHLDAKSESTGPSQHF